MSLRPAASLFDRPVRRVTASTTVTACCLTRGCIPCLTTSSIRTGTWDPRRAVRSSRDKLVSEPLRRPGKRTRERIAASSKKTEYHHRVRGTHGDCCEEDRSTGGRLSVDRRRQTQRGCHCSQFGGIADDRSVRKEVQSSELEKVEVCED